MKQIRSADLFHFTYDSKDYVPCLRAILIRLPRKHFVREAHFIQNQTGRFIGNSPFLFHKRAACGMGDVLSGEF